MMSNFIRLYDSKYTPITGDVFVLKAYYYSEDNDIKDTTGSYLQTAEKGRDNLERFRKEGYTYGDPTSTDRLTSKGGKRYPLQNPRQFYLVNDTSGSTDSDFVNELSQGDVIALVDNSDEKRIHKFTVLSTGCKDCDANTVKLVGLDYKRDNGSWELYNDSRLARQVYIESRSAMLTDSTVSVNNHATSAAIEQSTDTYIDIHKDTIIAYKENPSNKLETIITFKEGVFPKGGYTVLKDITHTGALNDIIIDASSYMGDQIDVKIEIDSTTNPETFKWRYGEYISSTTPSNAYAELQRGLSLQFTSLNLGDGEIKVKWLAATGHTTDTWSFTVYPNNKRIYRNQIKELDQIYK
jgi:hypothetical protein